MTISTTWLALGGLALALAAGAGCETNKPPSKGATIAPPPTVAGRQTAPVIATAKVMPASGSKVSGTVTFTEKDGKTEIAVDLEGLEPGKHGFHVHEIGDCSAPDATSAGGHFDPDHTQHGSPDSATHHAGDLGNLTANKKGEAKTTMTVDFLTVTDTPHSVVGRSVVVHANADDLETQPAGNAGPRIGCGVVRASTARPGR